MTKSRSNEYNEKLDPEEYKLLNPKEFIIEDQDNFDKSFNYKEIKKYGNSWERWGWISLYNLIRQLNSLNKVTSLIKNKNKYKKYLYIRPDLNIVNKINIDYIKNNYGGNYLLTPNWGKWDGLNDRFAIGNYESILKYGERINYIYDYMKLHGKLHSERLVKYIVNKYGIKNYDIDIILLRIRSNGIIPTHDLDLLKKI